MELFFHIGMQKTGSKAIQSFLARRSGALANQGLDCALDLRAGVWHEKVFTSYDDVTDTKISALARRSPRAVLSFERAYASPNRTIERLLSHSRSAQALLFCREPVAWANSLKNQVLKAHRTRISDWHALTPANGRLAVGLTVEAHLERWEKLLGRTAIRAVSFNPQTDVIPEFATWLGVATSLPETESGSHQSPNKALDAFGIRVMLEVKKRISETDDATHVRVVEICHKVLSDRMIDTRFHPAPLLLSGEEIRLCETRFGQGRVRILERYGNGGVSAPEMRGAVMTSLAPSAEEQDLAHDILARAAVP
ncbi:hypothetical protein PH5382_02134 [Phaeobacter sp. CECT 5382]|uniref:hypothetical protein n=1 Tax=Phaeobacter sp. CECT 5382 TaxID=1712645 RepID=UPI0006D9C2ED|nr:hypothetical protein [Phaeobacter sp. CECT 5382]CUH88201.1 hypothetical protein PH5382_02134 [Phaeobacter sp. CECT 5382]